MADHSLLKGAIILLIAAVFNRVLGFIFQAFIFRSIGAEGVGLFNMVYPVYILLIVITTAGIPLALSKMVAEETARGNCPGARRIFHIALIVLFFIGFIITVITYFSLPLLLKYVFINKKVYICFLVMLPGVFIVALTSVFRGYFQGLQHMLPPAVSQVGEQSVRVFSGLLLAYYFLPRGIEYAAAGVAAGGVLGELAGLLVLLTAYLKTKHGSMITGIGKSPPVAMILKDLAKLCTPITGGRILATLILSVDSFLIPSRLKAGGFTIAEATFHYGLLSGVAMTLLFVPTVVTISLATTMVPAVSETIAVGNIAALRKRVYNSIKITVITGIPFLVLFYTTPGQITDLIFGSPGAGKILQILALGGIFLYLQQTTTGIIQGLGSPAVPLFNMIFASIIKIPIMYFLVADPGYGISGAAYAYMIYFLITAALNLLYLIRKKLLNVDFGSMVIKPGIAAIAMFITLSEMNLLLFSSTKSNPLAVLCAGLLAVIIYIFLILLTGTITRSELRRLLLIRK